MIAATHTGILAATGDLSRSFGGDDFRIVGVINVITWLVGHADIEQVRDHPQEREGLVADPCGRGPHAIPVVGVPLDRAGIELDRVDRN